MRDSLWGNFRFSCSKIHASSALGQPVSQCNRDHPQRRSMEALSVCVGVCVGGLGVQGCGGSGGCGEVLSKQLSNPFFNDFGVGGGFVFFTPSLSSLTDYDNIYDHRFK